MAKEELLEHAYLQSVRVKGFRTLKDSEVTFVPGLNVIIGQNGVGKSNLLKIIEECHSTHMISIVFQEYASVIRYGKKTFGLNFEYRPFEISEKNKHFSGSPNNYFVTLKSASGDKVSNQYLAELYDLTEFYIQTVKFNIPDDTNFLQHTSLILTEYSNKSNGYYKVVNPNGDYSFLGNKLDPIWKKAEAEEFRNYLKKYLVPFPKTVENLKKYSPIKDSRLSDRFGVINNSEEVFLDGLYYEFFVGDAWLPWSALSDGTKRLFYLIHQVTIADSVVLIEEPELGVHPHQFHSIMLFLKEQAQYKQIILTTHSPYALNVLRKDDLDSIIIAKLDKDKGSVFKHLNEEQKAKAIRYMTEESFLSDYWMHSDLEDDEEQED